MNGVDHICDGLVLAAGASSRMGMPKALLTLPGGERAIAYQTRLLIECGCRNVVAVIGSEADRIQAEQPLPFPCARYVVHENWAQGRLSSLMTGLRALHDQEGVLIMPVDAIGISRKTLGAIISEAESGNHAAVRASFNRQPGHVVWLSRNTVRELLKSNPGADTPLNEWLRSRTFLLEVHDPAVLNNANTPEEWRTLKQAWIDPRETRAPDGP